MSKKEYNLEEYEEFYNDTKRQIGKIKSEINSVELLGLYNTVLEQLEDQYNTVLLAKPGTVLENDEIRIIIK